MKFKIIFILLVSIFLSGCAVKRDGTINLNINDCNEIINIKENSFQAFFKDFTCEYTKNKDEKIYGGTCYSFDMKNDKCLRAYTYEVSSKYNCIQNSEMNINGDCVCNDGYIFYNNKCIPKTSLDNNCINLHGTNSYFDINKKECVCNYGQIFNNLNKCDCDNTKKYCFFKDGYLNLEKEYAFDNIVFNYPSSLSVNTDFNENNRNVIKIVKIDNFKDFINKSKDCSYYEDKEYKYVCEDQKNRYINIYNDIENKIYNNEDLIYFDIDSFHQTTANLNVNVVKTNKNIGDIISMDTVLTNDGCYLKSTYNNLIFFYNNSLYKILIPYDFGENTKVIRDPKVVGTNNNATPCWDYDDKFKEFIVSNLSVIEDENFYGFKENKDIINKIIDSIRIK